MSQKKYFIAMCLFASTIAILFIAVSGTVTEKILDIPLLDFGLLWAKAAQNVQNRLISSLTEVPDVTSIWFWVKVVTSISSIYGFWWLFMRPLNRVRKLGDIGYIAEGEMTVKETANFVQKRRRVGATPPVYPNGWYGLMESFYLKKGEAKTVSCLGQNLAVFRDDFGQAHALDAYCPHMGANLAAGGRVLGDCIECPFHAWRFRGEDGKCTHIPYTDKIPEIARVKSWPVREVTGWIFLWYHCDGAEPTWVIPEKEDVESGKWIYKGRTEHHINAHIQEIPENGADVIHLDHVHGPVLAAGIDLRTMWNKWWSFAEHRWTAGWEVCPEPNGHIGQLSLTHKLAIFGIEIPFMELAVLAKQIGPSLVYLEFTSVFGKGMFLMNVLPMAPMTQKVVHNIYVSSWMPTFIAKMYMIGEALQMERDVMIWNNKQYEGRPMFVKSKEDSLIAKHRRWFGQFYSENSPKIFQKDSLEF